ncbi:MAG: PAS domain S-box protein, partial [Gallionellaceae bacterium]|nr:PAS domain S-box protein [Gallionellaceae bacterium]
MTDSTEKLRHELQAAQRALAEARAQQENRETTYQLTTLELEESRSALLFMLEDIEAGRRKIEQAHQEWMAALDAVNDPIFLHDKQFRILRCNKAYQQCAGIPLHELIGRPYYEVFPKAGAPLPCCLRAMEEEEEEEEVIVGETIYRSRAFSIHDEQSVYLYSVHTLEDITESRRAEAALHESEEKFRKISESAQDAIIMMADKHISFWNAAAERIFGYTAAEALGQELHTLIVLPEAHS